MYYRKNISVSLKIASKAILVPLSVIGRLLPLNTKVWVLGTGSGEKYNDNSKYFHEYIFREQRNLIKPIWLTKNDLIVKNLRDEGKVAYKFYSLRGIYFSVVADVAVVSTSWIDLPLTTYLNPRKKIIQLWHGTSLKKGDLRKGTLKVKLLRYLLIQYLGREFDMIITAAKINVKVHASKTRFNINKRKIKVTGQPRIDILFKDRGNRKLIERSSKESLFLYLPTWRNYSINLFDDKYGFSFKMMNQFLENHKSYLIVKLHPKEYEVYKRVARSRSKYKRIKFVFHEDIYPYLRDVDYFITDYSSIYFDLLLLSRPILFLPIDMEEYISDMGFYYDYSWVCAGPIAKDWTQAMKHMKAFLRGEDRYIQKRAEMSMLFNKYSDGENSSRVFSEIMQLLQG